MALEEPQLNGRIASVIGELSTGLGWTVREELWNDLRGPKTKPDILITRADAPPIALENEYRPAVTVEEDCRRVLGRELNPEAAGATGVVSTVIALRSPEALHQCDTGDAARDLLAAGDVALEYAAYQGTVTKYSRFPEQGFIAGDIRNLLDFIKPAAEPRNAIERAAKELREGTEDAAALIMVSCTVAAGIAIGQQLRQPYPLADDRDSPEAAQQKYRQRTQTARMAAAIMIDAMAYQENLAGYRGIKGITQVQAEEGRLSMGAVIRQWDYILSINYWPIFYIAKRLLLHLTPYPAAQILERMARAAANIQEATRTNDVAGEVFQQLIADRQTLATYYTRPESTTLAAYLAVPENRDWADPETLQNYHIADYACGTGGLVLAAYQRARELHRNYGGNPDAAHSWMMENALTACDIMPAGVHLAASLLSSVASREHYERTRSVLYGYGGTGNLDEKGNPEVSIGSLELLDLKETRKQAVLPLSEQMAMGGNGEQAIIEVDMSPLSQDLVIMNPPFTTPTNIAPFNDTAAATEEAEEGPPRRFNPAFAAFQTTPAEQKAMSDRTKQLGRNTIGDGYAGLGTYFTAIAHNMVKPDGHIALILPISALLGGSYDGRTARSWQKLRQLLADGYNDIVLLTIAQAENRAAAFSADTDIAEVMVVARRLAAAEQPARRAHFVNLAARPGNKLEAQETARAIRRAIGRLTTPDTDMVITIGRTEVGTVRLEGVNPLDKWTTARIANIGLVRTARALARGNLYLPQRIDPVAIPMTRMGQVGRVGPVHRAILNAFSRRAGANSGTEYPMLWNQNSRVQVSMATAADSAGIIKPGQERDSVRIWAAASYLHINMDFRFNANPTAAAFTERITAGGRAWPSLQMDTIEMEKATCAWLNGTLGMVGYWLESNRTTGGRGTTTVTAIPNIPTLDLRRLTAEQLTAAAQIYDDLCREQMLPANEAYRDPVRQELDRRLLTEVLGLDAAAIEQLAILRNQWCMEPTVAGTKSTGLAE